MFWWISGTCIFCIVFKSTPACTWVCRWKFQNEFFFWMSSQIKFWIFQYSVPKNQIISLLYPFEIPVVEKCKLLKLGKYVSLFLFAKRCFLHPKLQFTKGGWQFQRIQIKICYKTKFEVISLITISFI